MNTILILFTLICSALWFTTSDDLDELDFEDDLDSSQGDVLARFGRAVDLRNSKIVFIRNQRRRRIITCCGRQSCVPTKKISTTEGITTTTLPPTTTTTQPTTTTCTPPCKTCGSRNLALLNGFGNLLNKTAYGSWSTACNKTYLFGSILSDYPTAVQMCCDLGMVSVTLRILIDHQCLFEANNALAVPVVGKYLTSGWQGDCPDYMWCGRQLAFSKNELFWTAGEPAGGLEHCAAVDVMAGPPPLLDLYDVKCEDPATFVCESALTTCAPECSTVECTTLFEMYGIDGEVTTAATAGVWKTPTLATCDNKTLYLFSTATKSYNDAMSYCCSIGMQLLSIETPAEHQCLTDLNNAEMKFAGDKYLTSASSFNCKSNFKWCNVNLLLYPGITWATAQITKAEECAGISLATGDDALSVMTDLSCTAPQKFICEGPTTTTTTCATPTCTDGPCVQDNKAFWSNNGSVRAPAMYGSFLDICGSMYLFSTVKMTYCTARKVCCRLGMQLLSFETQDEVDCVFDFNNKTSKLVGSYWTSARTSTKLTGYEWCPTTNLVEYWWVTGGPKDAEFGATFTLDSRVLKRDEILASGAFTSLNMFACEEKTTTIATPCEPKCPSPVCKPDPTLFDLDGSLLAPATQAVIKNACGKTYYYSVPKKNFDDATKHCCAMNTKLATIDTQEENKCLSDFNLANMKFAFSYWISGSQQKCPGKFKWCSDNVTLDTAMVPWGPGEPTNYQNNEWCVQQTLSATKDVIFKTEICKVPELFFCEGPLIVVTTCATPTCTDVIQCEKDPMLFYENGAMITPEKFGVFHDICGSMYFFSTVKANYCHARKFCCRIGMNLLSLETMDEVDCLFDFNNVTAKLNGDYFVSARSATKLTGYEWCPTNKLVEYWWAAGEPGDTPTPELGVVFKLDYPLVIARDKILSSVLITDTFNFACEEITTTLATPCDPCPKVECTTQPYYFNPDGTLKDPGAHGNHKTACSKNYMFSWPKRNYLDAYRYCCAIGMKLLSVETTAENDCLATLNNADTKYTYRFWSSGRQKGCPGTFTWCGVNAAFTDATWDTGEPTNYQNNEGCVIHNYVDTQPLTLKTEICSSVENFICEGA